MNTSPIVPGNSPREPRDNPRFLEGAVCRTFVTSLSAWLFALPTQAEEPKNTAPSAEQGATLPDSSAAQTPPQTVAQAPTQAPAQAQNATPPRPPPAPASPSAPATNLATGARLVRILPDPGGAPFRISKDHVLLDNQFAGKPITRVFLFEGTTSATSEIPALPFFVWAANSKELTFDGDCFDDWADARLYVGGFAEGHGAPWVDTGANVTLCRHGSAVTVEVRGDAEYGWKRWSSIEWRSEVSLASDMDRTLTSTGELPSDLLPPIVRPLRLDFSKEHPERPLGYVYRERRLIELTPIGMGAAALAYAIPLLVAFSLESDLSQREQSLLIPIVGPLIYWGKAISGRCTAPCEGGTTQLSALEGFGLTLGTWLPALIQAGGIGIAIAGPYLKKRWWERQEALPLVAWSLEPLPVRSGSGLRLAVRF